MGRTRRRFPPEQHGAAPPGPTMADLIRQALIENPPEDHPIFQRSQDTTPPEEIAQRRSERPNLRSSLDRVGRGPSGPL
jgi:hypothetical protein